MVDIKLVDKLWVRIRNKEFSSRAIRDSDLPQSRPISWGFINKFTHINDMPWFSSQKMDQYFDLLYKTASFNYYKQYKSLQTVLHKERVTIKTTCCYVNSGIVFVVSNEARDPSIQIVAPWPYVVDFEMTFIIRSCPELISLHKGRRGDY